jgi:hypothetical protein
VSIERLSFASISTWPLLAFASEKFRDAPANRRSFNTYPDRYRPMSKLLYLELWRLHLASQSWDNRNPLQGGEQIKDEPENESKGDRIESR